MPRRYTLTPALVAASIGSGVMCLSESGIGRAYRVFARRPGAELNQRMGIERGVRVRADLPSGASHVIEPVAAPLVRVDLMGPLEQRAGYHDICAGWSDGHDAVAERLCAAFTEGDVLLCIDSPGGACAGLQQGIDLALQAKTKHGRRVTVWANEQIGSAAAWWAYALGDEIFIPAAGQFGSLGARAQHESIAGLLEKEGIACTYFTWPDAGKVAFAPELPASDETRRRGERDVSLAGEAFAKAIEQSPVGLRYGLTRDYIASLHADMLTGQQAVDAGLVDGVATEAEVLEYALKLAQSTAAKGQETRAQGRRMARGETMEKRAEEEQTESKSPPSEPMPSSKPPGKEPDYVCASCGMQNEQDAKYCDQCGASMSAPRMEDEQAEAPAERQQPPPPKRMSNAAGLAEILGLREGASVPAQKAAAIDLRQVFDHAAALTGQSDPGAVLGALSAMSEDAAASGRLRAERDKIQRKHNADERQRLAHRLVSAGVARSDVFLDRVSPTGQRLGVTLAPQYAEMRLSTLRGVVEQKERNAPRRNPFEPDREASAVVSSGAKEGGSKETRIKAAMNHPTVLGFANRPGQTLSLEQLAKSFVESNFDLPNGAA